MDNQFEKSKEEYKELLGKALENIEALPTEDRLDNIRVSSILLALSDTIINDAGRYLTDPERASQLSLADLHTIVACSKNLMRELTNLNSLLLLRDTEDSSVIPQLKIKGMPHQFVT